ncbi:MAG: START-like domain-containing protein, partial [Paludibacter sp.]
MSKIGFSIEYPCKSASVSVLWNSIGTAPGLSEWFADNVSASGENYFFVWEKFE